jgi:hypothetical protein
MSSDAQTSNPGQAQKPLRDRIADPVRTFFQPETHYWKWWDRVIRWLLAATTLAFLVVFPIHRYNHPEETKERQSVSAYFWYHKDIKGESREKPPGLDMRAVFFATFVVVGVLLILYRGDRSKSEFWFLIVAGAALLTVAFRPMDWPPDSKTETLHGFFEYKMKPAPESGLSARGYVHYIAAVVFFVCLGVVAVVYAKRSLKPREESTRKLGYVFLYNLTGWGMLAVPAVALVLNKTGLKPWVYWTEWIGIAIFFVYWVVKIVEKDCPRCELKDAPTRPDGPTPEAYRIQARLESKVTTDTQLGKTVEAQKRTRVVLLVMSVTCAAMLIASYNASVSLEREFTVRRIANNAKDLEPPKKGAPEAASATPVPVRKLDTTRGHDVATEQAIRNWVESRTVSSSVLGIKVNIDDAPALGSFVLFIMSIWFLLSVRREYFTIYFLLKDTRQHKLDGLNQAEKAQQEERLKTQWQIYHGIISASVFSVYLPRFLPFWGGLSDKAGVEVRTDQLRNRRLRYVAEDHELDRSARWQAWFLNLIVQFVYWLPVITLVVVFVLDIVSQFQRSPFEQGLTQMTASGPEVFYRWSVLIFLLLTLSVIGTMTLAGTYHSHSEQAVRDYYDNICMSLWVLEGGTLPPEVDGGAGEGGKKGDQATGRTG